MKQSERNLEIGVPRTKSQREFYKKWVKAWRIGKPLDIDNEYGYLFDYMRQIIRAAKNHKDLAKVEAKIYNLQLAYPISSVYRKSLSFHKWAYEYRADTQIVRGNYREAVAILSDGYKFSVRNNINKLLSLKLFIGDDLDGWDLLYLRGWVSFTKWGKNNFHLLAEGANDFLQKKREELKSAILPSWRKEARTKGRVYTLKKLTLFYGMLPINSFGKPPKPERFKTNIKEYPFFVVSPFSLSDTEICKIIENTARAKQNLPLIGEGWISETDLYYTLKGNLPNLKVLFHASPDWLGRQHLDVFIPELGVAIEYQGEQHDKPIDFFGGEKAFLVSRERDERKRKLCKVNNIKLIEVRAGYSLKKVLNLIIKNRVD